MNADRFNFYEPPCISSGSISVLDGTPRRVKPKPPMGFAPPTNGGKPSRGTPADKRLAANMPKRMPPKRMPMQPRKGT